MLISKLHSCPLALLMFALHLFVCPVSRVSVPVKCVPTFDPAQSNPKSSLADCWLPKKFAVNTCGSFSDLSFAFVWIWKSIKHASRHQTWLFNSQPAKYVQIDQRVTCYLSLSFARISTHIWWLYCASYIQFQQSVFKMNKCNWSKDKK